MAKPLSVLIIEDNQSDAELIARELTKAGYTLKHERVENAAQMRLALEKQSWEIVVSDFRMPEFDGFAALELLRETGQDIPFILVSGAIGEETAVDILKAGANDYIMKGNLKRLVPAVERELLQAKSRLERKRAEEKLIASEKNFRDIAENIKEVFWISKMDWSQIYYISPSFYDVWGEEVEKLYEQPFLWIDSIIEEDKEKVRSYIPETIAKDIKEIIFPDYRIKKSDGSIIWISARAYPVFDSEGNPYRIAGIAQDITERKQAENELRENKELFDLFIKNSPIYSFIKQVDSTESRTLYASENFQQMIGISGSEMKGKTMGELFPAELAAKMTADDWAVVTRGEVLRLEEELNGQTYDTIKFPITLGDKTLLAGYTTDITERKREVERISYQAFLLANVNDAVYATDENNKITAWNPAAESLFGWKVEEVLNQSSTELLKTEYLLDDQEKNMAILAGNGRWRGEVTRVRKDGVRIPLEISIVELKDERGKTNGWVGVSRDITERKQAEEAMRIKDWAIESSINATAISDLAGNLTYVNPAFLKLWGYGSLAQVAGKLATSFWQIGDKAAEVIAALQAQGGWHGELIAKRKDGVNFDVEVAASMVLEATGHPTCMLASFADITERKKAEKEMRLLVQDLRNLTEVEKQNQVELRNLVIKLRKTVEGTIKTIALIVEARDPYTSGHQKRVAEISVAIAKDLGLSEEQIQGIYQAGLIHDLGKIQVPAEILSKPGQLTKLEFDMIKTHSKVGYDLLKGIEFPWPIAQIVYQHHERMDGSGYPRKLKGDRILIEARIIGIADVIEAMSSHRPYRPALGMNVALDEIVKHKGTLYDTTIVASYLKVIKKGYKFNK